MHHSHCLVAPAPMLLPLPPQPSFTAVPTDKLPATLKTLAVPDTGNLVVAGALPTITGQAAAAAAAGAGAAGEQGAVKGGGHPEAAKTWFNRLYLRVRSSTQPMQQQCINSSQNASLTVPCSSRRLLSDFVFHPAAERECAAASIAQLPTLTLTLTLDACCLLAGCLALYRRLALPLEAAAAGV
jgi:hypothetical protein